MHDLLFACVRGDLNEVKRIVKKIEIKNQLEIALRLSCTYNHFDIVNFLLPMYFQNESIENYVGLGLCLEIACYNGNFEIVKLLVENKADVNFNFSAPIREALKNRNIENIKVISFLLENGVDVKSIPVTCLDNILYYEKIERLKILVSLGFIFPKQLLDFYCTDYVLRREFSFVQFLIFLGGEINNKKHKSSYIAWKVWKSWRIIRWKKFFSKVVSPLYYSPGFPGYSNDLKEAKALLTMKKPKE